jgi:hypothetical protein
MLLAGSVDRIVCNEPVSFAADAVIYVWDLNGPREPAWGRAVVWRPLIAANRLSNWRTTDS